MGLTSTQKNILKTNYGWKDEDFETLDKFESAVKSLAEEYKKHFNLLNNMQKFFNSIFTKDTLLHTEVAKKGQEFLAQWDKIIDDVNNLAEKAEYKLNEDMLSKLNDCTVLITDKSSNLRSIGEYGSHTLSSFDSVNAVKEVINIYGDMIESGSKVINSMIKASTIDLQEYYAVIKKHTNDNDRKERNKEVNAFLEQEAKKFKATSSQNITLLASPSTPHTTSEEHKQESPKSRKENTIPSNSSSVTHNPDTLYSIKAKNLTINQPKKPACLIM